MKSIFKPICLIAGVFCIFFVPAAAQTPIVNTIAGSGAAGFAGDGSPAIYASMNQPSGIAVSPAGILYITDEFNNRIRKVVGGIISTFAGNGPFGPGTGIYGGDGGLAVNARLNAPLAVAVDDSDNVYIADTHNYRIRKVNTAGIISTVGGTGILGYTGDGTPATNARISDPQGIAIDHSGNIYFSDVQNAAIRKISASGIITTIAGTSVSGFSGDGGPATMAQLNTPRGLKVDATGNVYFADNGNNRVRKIDTAGIITTFAGGGTGGPVGPATAAAIIEPGDVALDAYGNMFISSESGSRVYRVNAGMISAYASNGSPGYQGDGCGADTAQFNLVRYLAEDPHNNLYIDDVDNNVIRKVTPNHYPYFVGGHAIHISVCTDTVADLDSTLVAFDSDMVQPETWLSLAAPVHGTATINTTGPSTGANVYPSGTWYTPSTGYVGADSFTVQVMDCVTASDITTVYVNVLNCSLGTPPTAPVADSRFYVYPNPTNGDFTCYLATGSGGDVTFRVTDMLGKVVCQNRAMTNQPVRIKGVSQPGIYFVTAVCGKESYYSKLVIGQ